MAVANSTHSTRRSWAGIDERICGGSADAGFAARLCAPAMTQSMGKAADNETDVAGPVLAFVLASALPVRALSFASSHARLDELSDFLAQ